MPKKDKDPYALYNGLLVRTVLVREFPEQDLPRVACPDDVYGLCCSKLENADREVILALAIDAAGNVRAIHELAVGSESSSLFSPLFIIKLLILTGCRSMVLVHNHPSGDITPSPQDEEMIKNLQKILDTMDMRLLDSIIIGGITRKASSPRYLSMLNE